MERLDYFRKPKQDLERSTWSGCILTLLTFVLIIYLSVAEFFDRISSPRVIKEFTVKSGLDQEKFLAINIDILFLKLPCSAFSFTKKDLSGNDETSASSGLKFTRLSSNNQTLDNDYINHNLLPNEFKGYSTEVQKIVTGLNGKEKCKVKGRILVNDSPGTLIFDYRLKKDSLEEIKQKGYKLDQSLILSHIINQFEFQDSKVFYTNSKYNTLKSLGTTHDEPFSCSYFLKVIPVTDKHSQINEYNSYQYSYHADCAVLYVIN